MAVLLTNLSRFSHVYYLLIICTILFACDNPTNPQNTSPRAIDTSNLPILTFSFGTQEASIDNGKLLLPELSGNTRISATLSKPASYDISFTYQAFPASAQDPNDYSLPNPLDPNGQTVGGGKLTILAGDLQPEEPNDNGFPITIINEDLFEKDELIQFFINAKESEVVLNLKDKRLEVIIVNDEPIPVIEVANTPNNIAVSEGGESVVIELEMTKSRSPTPVVIKYQVSGTPGVTVNEDFLYPGTPPGTDNLAQIVMQEEAVALIFDFPIISDLIPESQETITFTLISAEGANISTSKNQFVITVTDKNRVNNPLNDTGVTRCYDDEFEINCGGQFDDTFVNEDGSTTKPYDFYKINNISEGPLPSSATEWGCVYDKNTELLWEVKVYNSNDTDRQYFEEYTWFNSNAAVNGGESGLIKESDGDVNQTDTDTGEYARILSAKNADGLCGSQNWRVPNLTELLSIMDFETLPVVIQTPNLPDFAQNALIDIIFFPYIRDKFYWTSTPATVNKDFAWCVFMGKSFLNSVKQCPKNNGLPVIMVSNESIFIP